MTTPLPSAFDASATYASIYTEAVNHQRDGLMDEVTNRIIKALNPQGRPSRTVKVAIHGLMAEAVSNVCAELRKAGYRVSCDGYEFVNIEF